MWNGEKRAPWNEFDGTLRLRRKRRRELCFGIALVAACLGLFEAECSPTLDQRADTNLRPEAMAFLTYQLGKVNQASCHHPHGCEV